MKHRKRRSDRVLLLLCAASFLVYIVIFGAAFAELPLNIPPWHQRLLLYFHFVPMFFLQLLLCRTAPLPWRLVLPVIPPAAVGVWFLSRAEWDAMAWILYLFWCVPPLLGCLTARAVWALCRKRSGRTAGHDAERSADT